MSVDFAGRPLASLENPGVVNKNEGQRCLSQDKLQENLSLLTDSEGQCSERKTLLPDSCLNSCPRPRHRTAGHA